jgi:hypothetical protein
VCCGDFVELVVSFIGSRGRFGGFLGPNGEKKIQYSN